MEQPTHPHSAYQIKYSVHWKYKFGMIIKSGTRTPTHPNPNRKVTMSELIKEALEQALKEPDHLTRIQVYHLTQAGLLSLNKEGVFVATPKATRKAKRGKSAALVAEWTPKVVIAVKELIKNESTTIRVDDVWKFLGSPDKAQFRSPILKSLQLMRDEGLLTQHKRGASNFGIYYTSGPNWA